MNRTSFNKNMKKKSFKLSTCDIIAIIVGIIIVICLWVICEFWEYWCFGGAPPPEVQIVRNGDEPRDPNPPSSPGNGTPPPELSGGSASCNPKRSGPNPNWDPDSGTHDLLESLPVFSLYPTTSEEYSTFSSGTQPTTSNSSDTDGSQLVQTRRDSNSTVDLSEDDGLYFIHSNSNSNLDVDTFDVRTCKVPEDLDRLEDNDSRHMQTPHSNPTIMWQDLGMCKVLDGVPIDHSDHSHLRGKSVPYILQLLQKISEHVSTDQAKDKDCQIETFRMSHILEGADRSDNNVGEIPTRFPDPTVKSEDLEVSHHSETDVHVDAAGD